MDHHWNGSRPAQAAIEVIDLPQSAGAPHVLVTTRDQYGRILQKTKRDFPRLVSHPTPMAKNGRKQLTRASVAESSTASILITQQFSGEGERIPMSQG